MKDLYWQCHGFSISHIAEHEHLTLVPALDNLHAMPCCPCLMSLQLMSA